VHATFTPEQVEIERTLAEMAADGLTRARACLEDGWTSDELDRSLVEDFGALGLPEELGGFGGGMVDVAVAVEALARTLLPTRLPAHLASAQVAAAAGLEVPEGMLALALDDGREPGTKTLVAYGAAADAIVVWNEEGVSVVAAEALHERESLDPTRPCVDLTPGEAIASGPAADGSLRAALVAAADLCGAARGALELGAAYARDREQFGRPIGSYQGIAFQLAEAFVAQRAAWDLTVYAAWTVDVGDPSAAAQVHAAKAKAGQAALFAAERTLQVHGGIGMTLEADPHLYLRRALFDDAWFGTGRAHRLANGRLRLAARSGVEEARDTGPELRVGDVVA
jgi:alkylation response protein AidB-like acyl-CoA dehydrogenase